MGALPRARRARKRFYPAPKVPLGGFLECPPPRAALTARASAALLAVRADAAMVARETQVSGKAAQHRGVYTPALRLAVIRPRTGPNREKDIHIHPPATVERSMY